MKTMNGFTNELLVKKAKRNWRTRCGAFLLAVLAAWCGGAAQDAYGQATLTTNATFGDRITIDNQQTANRVAPLGDNIGVPEGYMIGYNGTHSITWANNNTTMNPYGLDLADVAAGRVQAYRIYTPQTGDPNRVDNYIFGVSNAFNANNTEYCVTTNVNWTGTFASSGTFNTLGNTLTVGNGFSNASGLVVNHGVGGSYGGWLVLNGGNNASTINIGTGGVRVASNNFNNSGTITISNVGVLALNAGINLGGTLVGGGYNGSNSGRGYLLLDQGDARFSGTWSGEITVSSGASAFNGYTLDARSASVSALAGLSTLRITGGARVVITSAADPVTGTLGNIGNANIVLSGGGTLAKHQDTGILTLHNNVQLQGAGSLDAYGTIVGWTDNANSVYDAGNRIIVKGNISSQYTRNQTLHINARGGWGAVSLQNNMSYDGSYQVHSGTLEVATGNALGNHGDPTQGTINQLIIGSSTDIAKANFRVINNTTNIDNPDRIARYIVLANEYSTYEVFTGDIEDPNADYARRSTLADSQRATVFQEGAISGSGSLNKAGDGVLVLAAAKNGYTGDTIIHHGVLSISDINQINDNDPSRFIKIGSVDYHSDSFRPVFETTLGADPARRPDSGTLTISNAKIEINQANSVFRTTGAGNETIVLTEVTSSPAVSMTMAPVLNKEGAGTLTLKGKGTWGKNLYGDGETVIRQGTLQFFNQNNLASGDITIGATLGADFVNMEGTAEDYEAVLKLADGMGYQKLPNNIILGNDRNAYIEVGLGSDLAVNQVTEVGGLGADLNKRGEGNLTLNGKSSYGGWTNVEQGSLTLTVVDQIIGSKGVDLMGENTTLDMTAADQTLKGLRGGYPYDADWTSGDGDDFLTDQDDPQYWTRKVLIGDKTLTLDIQNFDKNAYDNANKINIFRGNIVGTGEIVKANDSILASGFVGYEGTFNIMGGTLRTLSDTTITGLKPGKEGTYLDIYGHTLTVNIGDNQSYRGTIISSQPALPWNDKTDRPHLIKDGVGTLTAGFYSDPQLTGNAQAFRGDLTMKQGNIISTTDYYMEGGGELTFYANIDGTGSITPLLLQAGVNSEKKAVFAPGDNNVLSTVNVNITDSATGWQSPKGNQTVGIIRGNSQSRFDGLKANDTNSLFYSIMLNQEDYSGYKELHVDINVSGFAGVGDTYNTIAVGNNLDNIRLSDLSGNNLSSLLKDLWAAGCNIKDAADRDYRAGLIRDVYQQLSGDTIANAMFMGLNKPWQRAFDRLNLDSQMVYMTPPGQGGAQAIANMRNLWFTPTVQSVTARSDGNARRFSIERSGFEIGFDKRVAQNTSIGFMLGHDSPTLRQGDDRVEADDFQFGVYAGTMIGYYVEMKGFIGFGHQTYKSNRNIYLPNDKIISDGAGGYRPIGGTQRTMTTHGRFDGDTFNFSLEVARPLFLGFAILRPTIGLDSEHAYRYGFTESGDAAAMKFSRSSLSRTMMRFGLGIETCSFDRAIFSGYLGYSTLLGGKDYATASGQFVDVYSSEEQSVRSVAVGKSYFDAGVGTRIFLNPAKTLTLGANYNASVANRWAEHRGDVGFQYIY